MPMNYPGYTPQYYPMQYMDQLTQLKYQPYQAQAAPTMQQNQTPNAGGSALLWVQGEAGAKSYLVAPGATVLLMDSEKPRFYIKTTDTSGMPAMRTYEYTEITNQPPQTAVNQTEYDHVTHEELENFRAEIREEMRKLTEQQSKRAASKPKAEAENNE